MQLEWTLDSLRQNNSPPLIRVHLIEGVRPPYRCRTPRYRHPTKYLLATKTCIDGKATNLRQAAISQWRILHAFQSEAEALTASTICERSTLSLRTVKTYLPKLVKHQTLQWSLDEDGKTKKYTLRDKSQFGRPLEIRKERRRGRKEQAKRLLLLGLKPVWLRRKPKRPPDWKESAKMVSDILDPNYTHTSSYVKRETGMGYKSHMSEGHKVHVFSIMHQQRPMIPKATREAKKWARTLHDGGGKMVAPHRYKYGSRPLREEAWIRYKPCPKCEEWIAWFPCRKCGYLGLKEMRQLRVAH